MTLSIISGRSQVPVVTMVGLNLHDRWYLDFISRRDLTKTNPHYYGSLALQGEGVTVFLISSGVTPHAYFGSRVTHALGIATDHNGMGSALAFVLGAWKYGVAPKCHIVSLNVYDDDGLNLSLYEQAVNYILLHKNDGPCLVLSSVNQQPYMGHLIIDEDLDFHTQRLVVDGVIFITGAGDGFMNGAECLGPMLTEVVHPACLENVIAVGALTAQCTLPLFSNYGVAVACFAPGVDIPVINNLGSWDIKSSTYLAAAIVAGIICLFLEKFPNSKRNAIVSFIQEHFLPMDQLAVAYPLDRLQKDPFVNQDFGTLGLATADGNWYHYLVDTQVETKIAHGFFTKVLIVDAMTSLGTLLANTSFEVQLNVKLTNWYNENKPVRYTLLDYSPTMVGDLRVGESSGLLFGVINNLQTSVNCLIRVLIEDGLHLVEKEFTLHIQPNYTERFNVGGVLESKLQNVHLLNIKDQKSQQLNVRHLTMKQTVTIKESRKIFLFNRVTGLFSGEVNSDNATGEFWFALPKGDYQAIAVDETKQQSSYVLDGVRV